MSEAEFLQQSERLQEVQERFLQGVETLLPSQDTEVAKEMTNPQPWPLLDEAALHGLAGEVVRLIEPHTEADPVALLASFLADRKSTRLNSSHT